MIKTFYTVEDILARWGKGCQEKFVLYTDHHHEMSAAQIKGEEQIAALTTDRDTAMSMLEDAEGRVKRLTASEKRLREVLEEIANTEDCGCGVPCDCHSWHAFVQIAQAALAEGNE